MTSPQFQDGNWSKLNDMAITTSKKRYWTFYKWQQLRLSKCLWDGACLFLILTSFVLFHFSVFGSITVILNFLQAVCFSSLRGSRDSFSKHISQKNQDQCFGFALVLTNRRYNLAAGKNISGFLILLWVSHPKHAFAQTDTHNANSPSPLSKIYLFYILTGISWHDQGNI